MPSLFVRLQIKMDPLPKTALELGESLLQHVKTLRITDPIMVMHASNYLYRAANALDASARFAAAKETALSITAAAKEPALSITAAAKEPALSITANKLAVPEEPENKTMPPAKRIRLVAYKTSKTYSRIKLREMCMKHKVPKWAEMTKEGLIDAMRAITNAAGASPDA